MKGKSISTPPTQKPPTLYDLIGRADENAPPFKSKLPPIIPDWYWIATAGGRIMYGEECRETLEFIEQGCPDLIPWGVFAEYQEGWSPNDKGTTAV